MSSVVGRFAPSPSGRMHLGNLFSALLAWLSVRAQNGMMVLRMEDLDPQRTNRERAQALEHDLSLFGLDWDMGGSKGGPHAPYYQSERSAYYQSVLDRLDGMGLIYPCFCTRAQLHAANAPHASDGELIYDGSCRNLSKEEITTRCQSRSPALRLRVPDKIITINDLHYGSVAQNLKTDCGDFILQRSDGVFAYQLAVVADDAAMGITQIVRGRDLLSSAPRQAYLFELLGAPTPQFAHIPLLLAPDGHRLSKRESDISLDALLSQGKSPQSILGKLAYIAGLIDRPEPVTAQDLIPHFSWSKIPHRDIVLR
ncbi:MAG: tRNA glutamyl-Q(34) synthetase GluQRS [Ruminococcaceae bacterium]|nr:tRNA glutamyl-Q(34) synthetase GluQRS [Oscillospiraceae bacterium]